MQTNRAVCFMGPNPSQLAAGGIFEEMFAVPNLEPIAAINSFDVEDIFCCQPQNATHGCGHVLVHPVGELNDDYRTFARRSYKATAHRSRATSEFPQYDLHSVYPSSRANKLHLTLDVALTFVSLPDTSL